MTYIVIGFAHLYYPLKISEKAKSICLLEEKPTDSDWNTRISII